MKTIQPVNPYLQSIKAFLACVIFCVVDFAEIETAFAQTILSFTNRVNWEAAVAEGAITENFSDTNLVADLTVVSSAGMTTNGVWFDDVGTSGAFTAWTITNATYAWGGTFDLTPGSAGVAAGLKFRILLVDGTSVNVPIELAEGGPGFFGFICDEPFNRVQVNARTGTGFQNEIYSLDDLSFSTGATNTARWVNPADGNWNTASNWDINAVPDVRSGVVIDPPASLTVTGPVAKIFVQALTLSATNTGIATLNLQTNTRLWVKESIAVGANGRLVANGEIEAASLDTAVGSTLALNGNTTLRAPSILHGSLEMGPHNLTFSQNTELRGPVSISGGTMAVANFGSVTLFSELRGAGNVIGIIPSAGSSLVSTGTLSLDTFLTSLPVALDANGNLIAITMSSTPNAPVTISGPITLNGGSINFPRYISLTTDMTVGSGTLRFGDLRVTNTFSVAADSTVITESVPPLISLHHQLVIESNLVLGANSALQVNGRFFGYGTVAGTNARIESTDDLYLGRQPSLPPFRVNGELTVESPSVVLEHLSVESGTLVIEGNLESGGSGSRATAETNAVIIYSCLINSGSCSSDIQFIFDGAGTHRVNNLFESTKEQFDAAVEFGSNAVVKMTLQGGFNSSCERDRVSSKIIFNSVMSFGGALQVVEGQGFSFSLGDTINLFEFNGALPTNEFDSVILPALPAGLLWFTNELYVTGALRIASTNDTDIDGLADAWEIEHFENLSRNGNGDFDSDGASDLSEFISGTDPKNVASVFSIRSLASNTTNLVLIARPFVAGRNYTMEQSFDLTPFSWFPTGDVTTEEIAGELQFSFPMPVQNTFFRVEVSPLE